MKLTKKVLLFSRAELLQVLGQLTEKQQGRFHGAYPHGVNDCDLESAHDLCMRTIESNQTQSEQSATSEHQRMVRYHSAQ